MNNYSIFLPQQILVPRIQHNDTHKTLPNGYQVHELPNIVEKRIKKLGETSKSPEINFFDELQTANECLNENVYIVWEHFHDMLAHLLALQCTQVPTPV